MRHGDCLGEEGMRTLEDKSIDLILCDLPYGTTANKWDKCLNLTELFTEYNRIIKDNGAIVLFGSQPFTTDLINANRKNFRYELVYEKSFASNFANANKMPLKFHENILIFYMHLPTYHPEMIEGKPYKKRTRLSNSHYGEAIKVREEDIGKIIKTRFPRSIQSFKKETGLHTTQKPVALCEWLIKTYTNEGDTVLDNCMGSGTTAIACKNTGRKFIGWELDKDYYNKSVERVK